MRNAGTLTELLRDKNLSDWANWIMTSDVSAARETLSFLERAFAHLTSRAKHQVRNRQNADTADIDALLHELLVHEVAFDLSLSPEFGPEISSRRPDLTLQIGSQQYVADVFLTNRPVKTLLRSGPYSGYRDGGEAAKKIADAISKKVARYRRLRQPLILFVAFAGYDVRADPVETALYGATLHELSSTGGLAVHCHEAWQRHGVFCPPGREANHSQLSAVVACDWFDSIAHPDHGRRLAFTIYHHWQPEVALPTGSFGHFPDVSWTSDGGNFIPLMRGESDIVVSTDSRKPVWAPYSNERPW